MNESIYPYFPVMLVDDEEQALNSFEMTLRSARMNHFVRCQDSRDAIPLLSGQEVEVMLLDLRMPHLSGEELLPMVVSDFPEVPVIVITGANDVDTAVKCMKSGAFDYMVNVFRHCHMQPGHAIHLPVHRGHLHKSPSRSDHRGDRCGQRTGGPSGPPPQRAPGTFCSSQCGGIRRQRFRGHPFRTQKGGFHGR